MLFQTIVICTNISSAIMQYYNKKQIQINFGKSCEMVADVRNCSL